MSCRRSSRPPKAGAGGCARPSSAWRPSARRTRSRCRAVAQSASRRPSARLEEELWTEGRANRAYEAYRARGRMKDGRRFGRPPDPYQPPDTPEGRVNVTDPDSRVVKGLRGFLQGYNAQAVTNEHQVVLAAEIETVGADFGHLEPMLDATQRELEAAGQPA
jgi:hypothetical protein